MNNSRDTFSELRTAIDGSDPFMTGGHQIITKRSDSKKGNPAWAKNDAELRNILLKAFPKLHTDQKQRKAAARWLRVVSLFYRTGLTRGEVAEELGLKVDIVKQILIRVRRAANGKTAKGTPRGIRPRGRPKKGVPIGTS